MNGLILIVLAFLNIIDGEVVVSDVGSTIQLSRTKSRAELDDSQDTSPISSTAITDHSDARRSAAIFRWAGIAIGAVVAGGFLLAYLFKGRFYSDVVEPGSQPTFSNSIFGGEGNTHEQLRLACTQALLCIGLNQRIRYFMEDDHSVIKDEYLPLFRARSSKVRSELSGISIADQLMRLYPHLPALDAENIDKVKKLIEKLLYDKKLANAISDVMKSNQIFYKVVMERERKLDEDRDHHFLKKALSEHGQIRDKHLYLTFPGDSKEKCEIVSKRIQELLKNVFKQEALKPYQGHVSSNDPPVSYLKVGETVYDVMAMYYRSNLDFDQEDDRKKRQSLF